VRHDADVFALLVDVFLVDAYSINPKMVPAPFVTEAEKLESIQKILRDIGS